MTRNQSHGGARKFIAAATALALGALGSFTMATVAQADPPSPEVGNIRADNHHNSITVHKHEKTSDNGLPSDPGNGELDNTVTGDPIQGVRFQVTPVLYNGSAFALTTNVGWTIAAHVADIGGGIFDPSNNTNAENSINNNSDNYPNAGDNIQLGLPLPYVDTDASGNAVFSNLDYGLYLVEEISGGSATNITDPSKPFLVTLPFPTQTTSTANPNAWIYDVHVYPKNSVTDTVKVPKTSDTGFYSAGDSISWTITVDIPVLASGDHFNTFTVTDTLPTAPAQYLAFDDTAIAGISPTSVVVLDSGNNPVSFTDVTDYNIVTSNPTKTVTFTGPGRTKLETSAQGGKVVFTVQTKVTTLPGDGNLVNDATSVVNGNTKNVTAHHDFGNLQILKYVLTGTGLSTKTALAGATFELYYDANNDGDIDVPADVQVSVGATNSWTTNSTGAFPVPIGAIKPGHYLLKETVPPVGYQIVGTGLTQIEVVAGPFATTPTPINYKEIANDQVPPWLLPFTGGNGVLIFTLVGGGMMALAIGFAFVAFKRRKRVEA
ncbi:MAG: SpaH/EbpB family LPXTG-anchored major pilin [Microbacteriaceae bacterium]|nr:SpaH/EbpB family LPXTG-anchored major pilin [Cryobacterium sp.]MCC6376835.1 SpaH/EbpB family LPXTG-anchored major pilin [Microbacteriaceae bacterium]